MGEVGGGRKRKAPLVLDWNKLMPPENGIDDEMPPLKVIPAAETPKPWSLEIYDEEDTSSRDFEVRHMSNKELSDSIMRMMAFASGPANRLPDGGEKLRSRLMIHEAEFKRRKLQKLMPPENGIDDEPPPLKVITAPKPWSLEIYDKEDTSSRDFEVRHMSNKELSDSIMRMMAFASGPANRFLDGGEKLRSRLMIHEAEFKRRKLQKLMPSENGIDDEMPPLKVIPAAETPKPWSLEIYDEEDTSSRDFEVRHMSNKELSDSIMRMMAFVSGPANRLPDGGEKLRSRLMIHEAEFKRRKLLKLMPPENGIDDEPPPLKVITAPKPWSLEIYDKEDTSSRDLEVRHMSNKELSDSIMRMMAFASGLANRFLDGGEKLRSRLMIHEAEFKRRKLQKDDEKCKEDTPSCDELTCIGAKDSTSPGTSSSTPASKSSFAKRFFGICNNLVFRFFFAN